MSAELGRQSQLPFRKAAQIAWRGIRVRLARSILVTGGIILPIAFLMYVLCSDSFATHVRERGSKALVQRLLTKGQLLEVTSADAKIQTRWMVGLALLISFVGILNAMLMSVTERFREIGTMKCLGALDSFVVKLFLLESTFQGVTGAVAGVALGLCLAFGEGLRYYGGETWGLLPVQTLLVYAGSCTAAGIVLSVLGAIYPALCAARMQAADAMRTEI